ncbi:MAG: ParB/RepB/Spo0J family partition protein [Pirellulales bacterium]
MSRERRLGRGLEALLGKTVQPEENHGNEPAAVADSAPRMTEALPQPPSAAAPFEATQIEAVQPIATPAAPVVHPTPEQLVAHDNNQVHHLSVYEIDSNPFQPRTEFDTAEIKELAESIRQHGVLQPVVVRPAGDRFQLISGERRWRAATQAGWTTVPAQVRYAEDREVAELTIVENLQRVDLGPLEKAVSFQNYLQRFQCPQEELAKRLSIDRSTVANLIRLLELPEPVQQAVRAGELSAGHARALLPLGEEQEQIALCGRIRSESLSVRATEEAVKEMIRAADGELQVVAADGTTRPAKNQPATRSKQVARLESEFRKLLGAKVDIKQSSKGKGRIVVHFSSHEEFERLREFFGGGEQKMVG